MEDYEFIRRHLSRGRAENRPAAKQKPKAFLELQRLAERPPWETRVQFAQPPKASGHWFELNALLGDHRVFVTYIFNIDTGRWRFRGASLLQRPHDMSRDRWMKTRFPEGESFSIDRSAAEWLLKNPNEVASQFQTWAKAKTT